jgi:transcriptional regulator of acetoin/glycerol metabolism
MVVEGAVIGAKGKTILRSDLPDTLSSIGSAEGFTGVMTFRAAEKMALERALEESGGNISKAARILDTTRKRVYNLMDRHGIRS